MRAHYYFSTALDASIIQGRPLFKGVHYCLRISNPERSLVPHVCFSEIHPSIFSIIRLDLLYTLIDLLYTLKKQGSKCAHYSRVRGAPIIQGSTLMFLFFSICAHYSRAHSVQGRMLFKEIRYYEWDDTFNFILHFEL